MSNAFPEITKEPWQRLWLLLENWESSWENGFVGFTGSSPSMMAALNFSIGNTDGPNPRPLEQVFEDSASSRALVLLGRPDAGKSHELRRFQRELPGSVLVQAKEIAEPLPQHLDREARDNVVTLIFDSLDESLIQTPNCVGALFNWLRRRDKRLGPAATRLVLSCRWADWPSSDLESSVQEWADQRPVTCVLLPLGQEDAKATAERVLKDKAGPFWQELRVKKLERLACWPRAFISMIRIWHEESKLPASPRALINEFVTESLLVTNDQDACLRQSRNPEDSKWMARVAGRLAATMFFCGKSSFSFSATPDAESLSVSDLFGTEKWMDVTLKCVKDKHLKDVRKRTSLLRSVANPPRLVFHSQVIQETLAASWLAAQQLSLPRLIHLFSKTASGVFPQLRALAAALAEQQADFRQWVLEHDPVVLLLADHSGLDDSVKHEIVEALLHFTQRVQVVDSSVWQGHLGTLAHLGLLDQLRPWLSSPATPVPVVRVAVEIAYRAQPAGTAEMLWEVLTIWTGEAKTFLARAITGIVSEPVPPEWQARWRSVIKKEIATDDRGILIGYALKCMVPKYLPVREAVDWLASSRRFEVIGLYDFFVSEAGVHVTSEDIAPVLRYLAKEQVFFQDDDSGPFSHENGVAVKTLTAAFRNLETGAVMDALAFYWAEFMNYTHFGCKISIPDQQEWIDRFSLIAVSRRQFALAFLGKYACTFSESMYCEIQCLLLDPETDGPWLLAQIPLAKGTLAQNLPQVVRQLFRWGGFRRLHPELLLNAWRASPYLQQILPAGPDEHGPLAALDRQEEIASREKAVRDAPRKAKIASENKQREIEWNTQLATMEAGLKQSQLEGALVWPEAYRFLLFTQAGRSGDSISHKYAQPPAAPEQWISEAARRYLLDWPANATTNESGKFAQLALTWLGSGALADEAILKRLEAVWLPWLVNGTDHGPPDWMPGGVKWLSQFPVTETTELTMLSQICHRRYCSHDDMTFLKVWTERWTEKHTAVLVNLLVENPIRKEGAGQAWFFLAEQDFPASCRVVDTWLDELVPPTEETLPEPEGQTEIRLARSPVYREMSSSLGATEELVWGIAFACCRGRYWDRLKGGAPSDDESLKKCLEAVQRSWFRWESYSIQKDRTPEDRAGWVQPEKWLSDSALLDFAEIIWRLFPRTEHEAANYMGGRSVTWQDKIIAMRYAVVQEAQRRGLMITPPAEDEAQVPRLRLEAQHHQLALAWHPFSPANFIQQATQPQARFARDNGQFMECVIEALTDWENDVVTPTGQAQVLNFETGKPWDEPVISKNLKEWLRRRLNIPGSAESQPNPTTSERLDVLLEWPIPQWNQTLSLIIEVKKDTYKSNGKTLRTEMEKQLLHTYLEPMQRQDKAITHGLYLVVWITGQRTDARTTEKLEKLRTDLSFQAEKLSKPPFTLRSKVIDARCLRNQGSRRIKNNPSRAGSRRTAPRRHPQ